MKQEEEKEKKIKTIKLRRYKKRFKNVKAFEIIETEPTTINLPSGEKLTGTQNDYYVCIDGMQDLIIPKKIFNKLFILNK